MRTKLINLFRNLFPTAIILVPLVGIFLVACKSLEQSAYRSIGTTAALVDSAMNAWGDYVRAGHATDKDQISARALYSEYQGAMRVARAAELSLKQAPSDSPTWDLIVLTVSGTADELINFISNFIPSLKITKPL